MSDPLVPVEIRGLPVTMLGRAREQHADLTREMVLIAEQLRQRGDNGALPVRFVGMVREMSQRYAMVTAEQEQQLAAAITAGAETVDLHYAVPVGATDAAGHLSELLDEADDYCRKGQLLLTLASPPEIVAYRRWFLSEFVRQAAGHPPIAWADHQASRDGQVS